MWRYFRRSSAPYCKVVESGLRCYPTTLLSFVIIFRWYLTTVLRFLHWASHGVASNGPLEDPLPTA